MSNVLAAIGGLTLVLALSVCSVGRAQDQGQGIIQMQENQMGNDERAKAHFRVGTSLYESGRFNEAAEEWQKAFELSQRTELLYNVYVAYRDAATSNDKAIAALRSYLERGTIEATRRLQLEARLRAMEEAQAQANATQASAPAAPPPPAANVTSTDPGAGTQVAATRNETGPSMVGPIVVLAAGGALIATAVVTGLMVNGIESDLDAQCPNDECPDDVDLEGERSKGNALIAINAITLTTGVLAIGAGVAWMLLSGDEDQAPSTQTSAFDLGCTTDGCYGNVLTRF